MSVSGDSTSSQETSIQEIGFNIRYRFTNGDVALIDLDRTTEYEFYSTTNEDFFWDGGYDDLLETVYINTNNILQLEEQRGGSRSLRTVQPRTIQRIEIEFGTVQDMHHFVQSFERWAEHFEQDMHYPVYLWTTELQEEEVIDAESGRTVSEPRFFAYRSYSFARVNRFLRNETVMDLSGLEDSVSEIQTETVVKPEPGMAELGRLFAKPVTTDRVVIDLTV